MTTWKMKAKSDKDREKKLKEDIEDLSK